jgi:hypothetical protein
MTVDPSAQGQNFEGREPIGADELRALRHRLWSDGSISAAEADELFALNAMAAPTSEWTDFFVEAVCDYLIATGEPRGYVTESGASWLIRQVGSDGRVESHAELELIVKLLEHADYVPAPLKAFALAEIEKTVLTGTGPTRRGGPITPGRIDDAEVALLRRLIFAPAGDAPAKVSRAEAEMLFRLKDATLGASNSPEWKRLFVQGVANHLMAHQSYVPPSPDEEARLERPYRPDPFGHVLSKLGHDVASPAELGDAIFGPDEDEKIADLDRAVAADAAVTPGEAEWLTHLFDRDGARDEYEQALVVFLAQDGVHLG